MMAMVDTLLWVVAVVLVVLVTDYVKEAIKQYNQSKRLLKGGLVTKEDKLTKEIKNLRLDIMELSEEIIDTNESIREDIAEAIMIIEEYQAEEQLGKDKAEYMKARWEYLNAELELDVDFDTRAGWEAVKDAEQAIEAGENLADEIEYFKLRTSRLKEIAKVTNK